MEKELLGVLVKLNNASHDLAVASFFVCILTGLWLWRDLGMSAGSIIRRLMTIALWSFVWIILAGIVRAVTYVDYEWMAAVGNSQVTALMVKHILLVLVSVWGIYGYLRLRRRLASGIEERA
jgi:hypothetical protein